MILMKVLDLQVGGEKKNIKFGLANDQQDFLDIYRLRYEVYSARDYIDTNRYSEQSERDDYDLDERTKHFIARYGDKLIGYVRVIFADPLPTEKAFQFDEPEMIQKIERSRRCEIGRLIIVSPDKKNKVFLPRRLVLLFLLSILTDFGIGGGVEGGYAFIKRSLENKMTQANMPIRKINLFKQIYPSDGVLYKYFTQTSDPVVPVFFLLKDFRAYVDKYVNKSSMFKKSSGDSFILRDNLYTKFLMKLKII